MKSLDKFKGCLIGGAIGDSLGYPVEFLGVDQIKYIYGANGITHLPYNAVISDDTQMTLFTANGILNGVTRARMKGISASVETYIYYAYLDWLGTQSANKRGLNKSGISTWISRIEELNIPRAPGNACLGALSSGEMGTIEKPINDSKGCGGVMRVAPIGLYFEKSYDIATKVAAITHGHILGYKSAGLLAEIISKIIYSDITDLEEIVLQSLEIIKRYGKDIEQNKILIDIVEKAIKLSKENISDIDAIKKIGQGWIAEECIAIAIYCSLKYSNDFEKAIIASVNHNGDSDSTGAVTGNILGAYLGLKNIPNEFIERVELREIIEEIAQDLYVENPVSKYSSNNDEYWLSKYLYFNRNINLKEDLNEEESDMEYCCIFDESEKEYTNRKDFSVIKVYDDVGAPGDCKRKLLKCNKCGALFLYQALSWNDDYYDDYIQVPNEGIANKLNRELDALRFRVKENPMIVIGSDNIVRYRLPNEEPKDRARRGTYLSVNKKTGEELINLKKDKIEEWYSVLTNSKNEDSWISISNLIYIQLEGILEKRIKEDDALSKKQYELLKQTEDYIKEKDKEKVVENIIIIKELEDNAINSIIDLVCKEVNEEMEENKEVSKDIKSRFDKILSLGKKDKKTENDKYIKEYEEKFGKKVVILEDIITYSKAIELIKESLKQDRDLLSEYISEKE